VNPSCVEHLLRKTHGIIGVKFKLPLPYTVSPRGGTTHLHLQATSKSYVPFIVMSGNSKSNLPDTG
jgi:hypothetical protein